MSENAVPEEIKCDCSKDFIPVSETEVRRFRVLCEHGLSESVEPIAIWGRPIVAAQFATTVVMQWSDPASTIGREEDHDGHASTSHVMAYIANDGDPDEFAIFRGTEESDGEPSIEWAKCPVATEYSVGEDGEPYEAWYYHGCSLIGTWAFMNISARMMGTDLQTRLGEIRRGEAENGDVTEP